MELTTEVNELYRKLLGELKKTGKLVVEEKKTSFHFKSGAAFAGVHPRKTYFILNIVSASPLKSPRIIKQEQVSKNRFHNRVKIANSGDIDSELMGWLKEAYALTSHVTP